MARPPLSHSLITALATPVETTLADLLAENGWQDRGILEATEDLRVGMEAWNLQIEPPLGVGGMDTPRVVRLPAVDDPKERTEREIEAREGPTLEFKETLVLDVRRHERTGEPVHQCGSDDVLLGTLKTIAAFLNTDGGTLLIGVTDDGERRYLEREFPLTCPGGRLNFDQWELYLRRKIERLFVDGRSITPSVIVQRVDYDDGVIARITVGKRRALSFISVDGKDQLFVRAGNQTLSIRYAEVERYFTLEKLYGA